MNLTSPSEDGSKFTCGIQKFDIFGIVIDESTEKMISCLVLDEFGDWIYFNNKK